MNILVVDEKFTFHGCQFNNTVVFPEGVRGAAIVFFCLGVKMHLQHLAYILLVHDFHREADRVPGNRGFVQGQKDYHFLR